MGVLRGRPCPDARQGLMFDEGEAAELEATRDREAVEVRRCKDVADRLGHEAGGESREGATRARGGEGARGRGSKDGGVVGSRRVYV